jgi:hypothetical protein
MPSSRETLSASYERRDASRGDAAIGTKEKRQWPLCGCSPLKVHVYELGSLLDGREGASVTSCPPTIVTTVRL